MDKLKLISYNLVVREKDVNFVLSQLDDCAEEYDLSLYNFGSKCRDLNISEIKEVEKMASENLGLLNKEN